MPHSSVDLLRAVEGLQEAQQRLERTLAHSLDSGELDDAGVNGASLLPGWTRGHVLSHLAGNAASITRGLQGALDGRVVPRYPGPPGARDREIELGASRSAMDLVNDVVTSAATLDDVLGRMTAEAWTGSSARGDTIEPVDQLPWRRWREVELHHLDLDLGGFPLIQWADDFVSAEAAANDEPSAVALRVAELNGRVAPDPAAWTATTLDPSWCRRFSASEIELLDLGLRRYRETTGGHALIVPSQAGTASEVAVLGDGFARFVSDLRRDLIVGSGVAAFEGFPVERYSAEELRVIWWLISCAVGDPRAQSHRGDLIGDVRDLGMGISGRTGRGYTSNSELNFHADVCDVSGLFFLKTAREGGVTRIASSVSTHDRIAVRRPDLLAELYEPMPCSWQGNQPEGEPGWYPMPVFGRAGGRPSCAYVRTNILLAAENAGAPSLTPQQVEAVQLVKDIASEPDLWFERTFEPGAMLFVHNHTVLHLRTAFVDWDEPERKRHLLRIWLSLPNNRRLPATFAPFFGDVREGAVRGGYVSGTGRHVFATE